MTEILTGYILILSIITFFVYGIDKLKARKSRRRISESTLLWLAFMGGSFGAWGGMQVWRHKTQHNKFRYSVPIFMLMPIGLLGFCWSSASERSVPSELLQEKIDSPFATPIPTAIYASR